MLTFESSIIDFNGLRVVDVPQRSLQWFAARDLRMTGSKAGPIQANGKGLETYIDEIVFEYNLFQKYGVRREKYISFDMKRGIELEPHSIALYELENNVSVDQVGFVIHDDFVGVSPDGLVGLDGGVESKARNDEIHYYLLENGKLKSEDIAQIQMCMMVCKRKWWDFISYNPNFGENSLFQKRLYPDFDMYAKLGRGIKTGTELIKQLTGE